MDKTAPTVPEEQRFILTSVSPSWGQKRLALGVVLASLVAFCIMAGPLSTFQLRQIDAFVPAYGTAIFVNDLITRSCCSTSSPSYVRVPPSQSRVGISSQGSLSSRGC